MLYESKPIEETGHSSTKERFAHVAQVFRQIAVTLDRPVSDSSSAGYSNPDFSIGDGACSGDCGS